MSKIKTWLLSQKPLDFVTAIFLIGIVVAAIVAVQTGNLGALISLFAIFWSVLAHHRKSTAGS